MKRIYTCLFFICAIACFTSMDAMDDPCHVPCKQNMPIHLGSNCQYTLTPDDVLHYPPPYCNYVITIYDQNNQPIGNTVNSSHVGQTLQVKVSQGSWSCWASIKVFGGSGGSSIPVAVCKSDIQPSLGSNGVARIYWYNIDQGSYVDCGEIASIQVRRKYPGWCPPGVVDDTQYRDYVELCCEDVLNSPVEVMLRITDTHGNYNECWTRVWVEDKLSPKIYCPPDITVNCGYPINYNNLSEFGTVHMSQSQVQPIYINDPHYPGGLAGYDGYITGGACGGSNLWVQESYHKDINCGQGIIYRIFTIEGTNISCTQKIFISGHHSYNPINWPDDVHLPDCGSGNTEPSHTGIPTWNSQDCAMYLYSYRDEVFTAVPDACFKILRHWSVIDWCTYDPNNPYKKGRWEHTQIIKAYNEGGPQFSHCKDTIICTTDFDECKGKVQLKSYAHDDCTPDEHLGHHWCVDLFNDGIGPLPGGFDIQGHTSVTTGYFPAGTHKILWSVEDLCGNYNTCSYRFTVKDCKKPSPVCLGGVSTAIMPSSGLLMLDASSFDASSFDNCTPAHKLRFSYSPDVNETVKTFDCNNIGTNELKIWVTDLAGNQQYCTVYLTIADNFDVCPDSAMTIVHGYVKTMYDDELIGTEVSMDVEPINIANAHMINEDGYYLFGSFAEVADREFNITLKNNNAPSNGVSVVDLLMMQKHILELQTLNDPLLELAADVNGDLRIDVRDIVETKKLLLNQVGQFSQKTSWVFVNSETREAGEQSPNNFTIRASTNAPVQMNFTGVKLGDLNGDAKIDGDRSAPRTSNALRFKDQRLEAGTLTNVAFQAEGLVIQGMHIQLPINQDLVQVSSVTDADGRNVDFDIKDGVLEFVHTMPNQQLKGISFSIAFEASQNVWLGEALPIGRTVGLMADELNQEWSMILDGDSERSSLGLQQSITPNPFQSQTEVVIHNDQQLSGNVQLLDNTGKILRNWQIASDMRVARINMESSLFPGAGLYFVKTQLGDEIKVDKLLKL